MSSIDLRVRIAVGLVTLLGILIRCGVAEDSRKLLPQHREWLEGPASLLITKIERESFALLTSDVQRDDFIEKFWAVRNPNAEGPANEFKEEFFARVSYANTFYGSDAGSEGWRTDRGRTYILFGKPKTSMSFLAHQELYPTELWFYSNPGLEELPPFFYVIFLERDGISGYRLYNPVTDGPDKIMRAGPSKAKAFQYLRDINTELAQATLTLIPGEMVDTDSYSGSMASIGVINSIRNFRDMLSYTSLIAERSQKLRVATKVRYDVPSVRLETFIALEDGDHWLHWRFEVLDPMQPKVKAGRVDFRVRAQLFSKDQLVYERTDAPGFAVPEDHAETLAKRPLAYEERFPVAPGEYRLVVIVENRAAGRAYESEKTFSAGKPGKRSYVSELLLASKRGPDPRQVPFEFAGSRFDPLPGGKVLRSHSLNVMYQIRPVENASTDWNAEYVIGSLTGKSQKTIEESSIRGQADANGVVLVTSALPIEGLAPGNYILALRLRNPGSGEEFGRSVRFQVAAADDGRPVVIARPVQTSPEAKAAIHYERALCWLSQQHTEEAYREAEASWRLSQAEPARQLMERLRK